MKNLATKLFAIIFIIILAAGCASSITAPTQDLQEKDQTVIEAPAPGDVTGGRVVMNRERPKL